MQKRGWDYFNDIGCYQFPQLLGETLSKVGPFSEGEKELRTSLRSWHMAQERLAPRTGAQRPRGRFREVFSSHLAPSTCAAIEGASATKAKSSHSDRPT